MIPSTEWKEQIDADESQRFAGYARIFAAIQARKSAKYGTGRALHRKQLTAASGVLEVLAGLPEFARQGLFAKPVRFDTWVGEIPPIGVWVDSSDLTVDETVDEVLDRWAQAIVQ